MWIGVIPKLRWARREWTEVYICEQQETFVTSRRYRVNRLNSPSNILCLVTKVILILWLLFSTKFSKSSLLCWMRFSSISGVQQVYPWGQKRRCSPVGERKQTASVSSLELWLIWRVEPVVQAPSTNPTQEDQAGTNTRILPYLYYLKLCYAEAHNWDVH